MSAIMKHSFIAGVDEVGRGPLAGDVVAAAVILPEQYRLEGLADSKKISEKKREILFNLIQDIAISFCISRATVEEIDQLNILHASMLAMKRAVDGLSVVPSFVKVDGNRLPDWSYESRAIVKGDSTEAEIMAASILAKVTRDREMIEHAKQFPEYEFEKHKGYPTKVHIAAIEKYGVTAIHRRSFGPVKRCLD